MIAVRVPSDPAHVITPAAGVHIELNCCVLFDDPGRVFPVEIASAKPVGALKDAIKAKKVQRLHGIDAADLDLWKASARIP